MVKKVETRKEQTDSEDDLLDFDLEDVSGEDLVADEDVIELVELVEVDKDQDKTRELPRAGWIKEKPAARGAPTPRAAPVKETMTPALEKALPEDEEEADLDLSDLTLDIDADAPRPAPVSGDDAITEADLENLLEEASEEEISFDLPAGEERVERGKEQEVPDADLEALLEEATAEAIEETEEEAAEEKGILGIVPETEAREEIRLEEERAPLDEVELAGEPFEEMQEPAKFEAEGEVPEPVLMEEEPGAFEEIPAEEVPFETLVGISEERLEEIITRVVEDVVERVARETMASVAERVIGQAIEALKASLESSSEES